jgi:predicted nucleic acid-binding protein
MERQKKVVDASVIAKWFLNEPDSKNALEFRDKHISEEILIIVPDLLFIEVLNALRYKGNDEKALGEVNSSLWEMQLHIERTNPFLLEQAINLSVKHKLSIYDAVYAALAQLHGCQLVTADKELGKLPQSLKIS